MTMTPRLRKLTLTAHITSSVGWLGAVIAYLAPAIAGLTSQDAQLVRAAYLSLELIGWFVIVPCSLTALLTGLVQSLGTEWGVFRHSWVLVKFLLTLVATLVLLMHMRAVSRMAGLAVEARERAVRSRPRCLHRRGRDQARPLRSSIRGEHLSR